MATRKPLVRIGGKNQQLPTADSIDVPGARFHEGPTEPTIKDYGDRWLHTTSGIKYTWVDPGVWVDLSEPSAADVADAIHGATSKTTPVDTDELGIADSADSWALKKLTWANLKATLLAYFKGQFREKLTAARTYYVRTDGSDSNDGLANTSGGALLTIQKAIDIASSLDNGGFKVTINVQPGTLSGAIILKSSVGSGIIEIAGNSGAAATTILSHSSALFSFGSGITTTYELQNITLQTTGGSGIVGSAPGTLRIGVGVVFGACASSHIELTPGAVVIAVSSYTISGAAERHVYSIGGHFRAEAITITVTGTPAFSQFAIAGRLASVWFSSVTFSGSATGPRYAVGENGVIFVGGAGATYLPGNSAGSVATGGVYA